MSAEKPVAAPSQFKPPPSFARRDRLLQIENEVQAKWAEAKVFEVDAPLPGTPEAKQDKFMCTFPFP